MAEDMKQISTEKLEKRIKMVNIVLGFCWGLVILSVVVSLAMGKTSAISAGWIGFLGLFVATIAMLIGKKRAKEEIARRGSEQPN